MTSQPITERFQFYALNPKFLKGLCLTFSLTESRTVFTLLNTDSSRKGQHSLGQVDVMYTDLSKAFDRIVHHHVLKKLIPFLKKSARILLLRLESNL